MHPIAILTNKSAGTQYSLRAANAAACVADYSPDSFFDFNSLLFENQPEELSAGLTNDELKRSPGGRASSKSVDIEQCIDETRFKAWVQDATNRALTEPMPNSDLAVGHRHADRARQRQAVRRLARGPAEFQSFVLQAAGETYSESDRDADPDAHPRRGLTRAHRRPRRPGGMPGRRRAR